MLGRCRAFNLKELSAKCDVNKFYNRQINSTVRDYTGERAMYMGETRNQGSRLSRKKECYNQRQRGKGILKWLRTAGFSTWRMLLMLTAAISLKQNCYRLKIDWEVRNWEQEKHFRDKHMIATEVKVMKDKRKEWFCDFKSQGMMASLGKIEKSGERLNFKASLVLPLI